MSIWKKPTFNWILYIYARQYCQFAPRSQNLPLMKMVISDSTNCTDWESLRHFWKCAVEESHMIRFGPHE